MNPAELRDHCLAFTGAEETFPFGPRTSVFKVAKDVCTVPARRGLPTRQPQVRARARPGATRDTAAVIPGYHLNKRHWNTVILDGSLPDERSAT